MRICKAIILFLLSLSFGLSIAAADEGPVKSRFYRPKNAQFYINCPKEPTALLNASEVELIEVGPAKQAENRIPVTFFTLPAARAEIPKRAAANLLETCSLFSHRKLLATGRIHDSSMRDIKFGLSPEAVADLLAGSNEDTDIDAKALRKQQAAKNFEDIAKSGSIDERAMLALSLLGQERYGEIVALLEPMKNASQIYDAAFCQALGASYLALKRVDDAIALLDSCVKQGGKDSAFLKGLAAKAHATKGDHKRAYELSSEYAEFLELSSAVAEMERMLKQLEGKEGPYAGVNDEQRAETAKSLRAQIENTKKGLK